MSPQLILLFDNKKLSGEPRRYVTNVDAIEALTGLDFFSELPDEIENKLEAQSLASYWNFNVSSDQNNSVQKTKNTKDLPKESTSSTQCAGKTKSGSRCKRKVSGGEKYCYQHK